MLFQSRKRKISCKRKTSYKLNSNFSGKNGKKDSRPLAVIGAFHLFVRPVCGDQDTSPVLLGLLFFEYH